MYTEIKELVNFVAKYLLGKIPRRPVSLFCEQYANFLAAYYTPKWNVEDPLQGESERMVRVRVEGYGNPEWTTDPRLTAAAKLVGIDVEELLSFLPEGLLLYANPGQVFYRFNETAPPIYIWRGDKDADKNYNPLPASAQHALATKSMPTSSASTAVGQATAPTPRFLYSPMQYTPGMLVPGQQQGPVDGPYAKPPGQPQSQQQVELFVRLHIRPYVPAPEEHLPVAQELATGFKMFKFMPINHVSYLAEQFALTRFGSHRQRPDHEVMRRIQQAAVLKHLGMASSESAQEANPPLAQDIRKVVTSIASPLYGNGPSLISATSSLSPGQGDVPSSSSTTAPPPSPTTHSAHSPASSLDGRGTLISASEFYAIPSTNANPRSPASSI